jgi:aspartate racemase
MRTIGLVGGMSWESTAVYYRLLNEGARDRLGGLHSAPLVLASVDFAEVADLQRAGRWDDAGALLAAAAKSVVAAGAELLAICTNTMHLVADRVAGAVDVPLVNLVDVTAQECLRRGARTVGLLGTAYTMEAPFYRDRLRSCGLDVLVPADEDRAIVHRVIFDELCRGVVDETSRAAYGAVVERLARRGAAAVVLGCTEIRLLLDAASSDVPLVDTTEVHCAALLDHALS